jgi:hypothetical protein
MDETTPPELLKDRVWDALQAALAAWAAYELLVRVLKGMR